MPKKKTTIEDLAVMVQKGFHEVDKRFGEVDKRFDGIEGRLINIESDISYLKSRVMEIGLTLEHHEEILEEHSGELRFLHRKIDELTRTHLKNAFGLQSANFCSAVLLGTHRIFNTNRSCGGGLATKFARFRPQSHF